MTHDCNPSRQYRLIRWIEAPAANGAADGGPSWSVVSRPIYRVKIFRTCGFFRWRKKFGQLGRAGRASEACERDGRLTVCPFHPPAGRAIDQSRAKCCEPKERSESETQP